MLMNTVQVSSVTDVFMISSVFVSFLQHEQMSVLMIDYIVKSLKAENENVLKEHGLDDRDVTFIKELIEGAKASADEVHADTPAVLIKLNDTDFSGKC